MAKPTQDPKWVTTDDPVNIIEPTAGAKLNGITSGGIWARENLNWMFNTISKWIDWVRDNVRSNTENDARYVQHTAVVNNVTSTSATDPLSANQGKVLKDLADSNYTTITNKFGTGASQVQTNAQNASEFVSHSEVINTLTSTSTTNPASANQVKVLKGLVDSNNTNTNARIGSTTASNVRNNSQLDAHYLLENNNLSDLTNPAVAIDNLGLRDNTENDARYLLESNNLSDLTSVATAVDNLGLRDNTENDARYVQHTEVVDTLTSTSTTNPSSANQAKVLKELIDIGSQVGDIKFTAGSVAPTGWIRADGSAISRTTYADLFSVVGTIYGTGNGTTTFNLPDLRGEFIRGWDDSRGADSGRTLGSFQDSDNKSHDHSATSSTTGSHRHSIPSRGNDSTGNGYVEDASSGGTARTTYTGYEGSHSHTITVGSSGGTESRPRNVAMLAVIKY